MIIRADGGNGIGMGHLARTSVLAQVLKSYMPIKYICDMKYQEGISFLRKQGFEVIASEHPLERLLNEKDDCLLTDHYGIDDDYIEKARCKFKVTGYIDDNVSQAYIADFILNQNFGAQELDYSKCKADKLLLGTDYLLVREEFRALEPISIHKEIKNILLTVGGSDAYNYTGYLLERIKKLPYHFKVVIGMAFPYKEALLEKYKRDANIHFEIQPKMSQVAQSCDMALVSCGSTLYEMGLVGVPSIGFIVADNQTELAERMEKKGLIVGLGKISTLSDEGLVGTVLKLAQDFAKRTELQHRNRSFLNPKGVYKAAEEMMEIIKNKS